MNDNQTAENWFVKRAKEEAKKDKISQSDQIGHIIGIAIGFLILLYFIAHQLGATGFFTTAFGPVEMFMLDDNGDGYIVNQNMTFKLRQEQDETGEYLYTVIRWIDHPSTSAASVIE